MQWSVRPAHLLCEVRRRPSLHALVAEVVAVKVDEFDRLVDPQGIGEGLRSWPSRKHWQFCISRFSRAPTHFRSSPHHPAQSILHAWSHLQSDLRMFCTRAIPKMENMDLNFPCWCKHFIFETCLGFRKGTPTTPMKSINQTRGKNIIMKPWPFQAKKHCGNTWLRTCRREWQELANCWGTMKPVANRGDLGKHTLQREGWKTGSKRNPRESFSSGMRRFGDVT